MNVKEVWKPIELESDSMEVINLLDKVSEALTELKSLSDDILELAPSVGVISFSHCLKAFNKAAHFLVREGARMDVVSLDLSSSP